MPDEIQNGQTQRAKNAIHRSATAIITKLYGDSAEFREGQYEAIEATLLNKRTLVVQRTGWGKSLVYFICTKLFRNVGRGVVQHESKFYCNSSVMQPPMLG